MINWTIPALAVCVAAIIAAWLDGLLLRRTGWSKHRRMLAASAPVPLLILLATACGIIWELVRKARSGDNMTDLAIALIFIVGAVFALLTAIGGYVGARMAERNRGA